MGLIERYIMRRIVVLFLTTLAAAIGIVWTTLVLGRINYLTTTGQSFLSVIKFAGLLVPDAIPVAMPFAAVIAIANTLSTMNQDSELVVINASGSPRGAVLRPVLVVAVALSVISFGVENFVAPVADFQKRVILATVRADLLGSVIQEGSFQKLDDNLYVEVAERKADGQLGGLFLADSRDPAIDLIYYAREATLFDRGSQSILLMKDGEVERRDVKSGNVSMIRFNTYAFDLSEFKAAANGIMMYTRERSLLDLMNPDANDALFKRSPQQFYAEIDRRLTDWTFPIVFALISFVIAGDARSHREMRLPPALVAIGLSFIIFWAHYFAYGKARTSSLFEPLLYIIPLGVIAVTTFLIATDRQAKLPQRWSDGLRALSAAAASPFVLAYRRLTNQHRGGEQKA